MIYGKKKWKKFANVDFRLAITKKVFYKHAAIGGRLRRSASGYIRKKVILARAQN